MHRSWTAERVLIVEPDIERSEQLREAIDAISFLTVCHDFVDARRILLATPPDLLVTNIFLDAYNGLHLAHLVACNRLPTKVIVYSIRRDAVLVADARDAGAFVEDFSGLAEVLPVLSRRIADAVSRRPRRVLISPKSPLVADKNPVFQAGIPTFRSATEL